MFAHLEAVAERAGEHARAGRRADQGKRPQPYVVRAGVDALPEHDVDAEILHGRVEILLHGARQAMDFVDEKHGVLFEVGQIGDEVFGSFEHGTAGQMHGNAQLARQAESQRGLPESGRAVEKDMPKCFSSLPRRVDDDPEPLEHFFLADDVLEPHRAEVPVEFVLGGRTETLDDRFARHGSFPACASGIATR